ncbi:Oxalate decarboxylase OxdC [Cyphellophora attinorum]|uniref:Oxalate decarboxylase OxdC n=1 Tax=Cyphellophora attinorum TaxID=1664694 RepID=A0A0N1H5Z7_9EURO|nr:Oxalate decarboxylase OxdC [Phialophora attinorum]KPI36604.1 Oxalate decarboxylase OxdC [Phialophora attinorum]
MTTNGATPVQDRSSKHKINLRDSRPVFSNANGSIQEFTTNELPMLKNLSLQKIELNPDCILEPKWFVNCNAIAYVLTGNTLVRTLDSASDMSTFTVSEGQMFHVHSGALFTVENTSSTTAATFLICARHEHPKEFTLSRSAAAFTDAVLANTFVRRRSVFAKYSPRSTTPPNPTIIKRSGPAEVPTNAKWPHPNRFDVEDMQAPTFAAGVGSAKKARAQYWKILTNIAMYSLRIEDKGMREPHWHPDTVEMGYIKEGHARMSIMDRMGHYPHQIEVIQPGLNGEGFVHPQSVKAGEEIPIHFLIFFDQPMPKDVGFRQAGTVMSRRVLAAAFGMKEAELPEFPYDNEDPLIVLKKNVADPVV